MFTYTRYLADSQQAQKEEMPTLWQAFTLWLSMFVATMVFAILMSLVVFIIRMDEPASNQVRSELIATKVCHSNTAFCLAQQTAYSELMEEAVLDQAATENVLKAKAKLAQTRSFELASEKTISQ